MRPIGVRIRTIGVAADIEPMGIRADHTVEVPDNPDDVGWYSLGSVPGQAGSAVLLGHVDSIHGPAVFARLRSLSRGADVEVISADGSTSHFEVTKSATYPNSDFPARRVYRVTGRPSISLVTCGGDYDRARGGYQANVVVTAVLVGTTRTAPPARDSP
jgi:sortase (surface protein transpeptidase)